MNVQRHMAFQYLNPSDELERIQHSVVHVRIRKAPVGSKRSVSAQKDGG